MANKKRKTEPSILDLMHEEEHEKLLQRGAEYVVSEREIAERGVAESLASNETINGRQMLDEMMARPSWLWHDDLEFVKSVSRQLEERRRTEPSEMQAMRIRHVYERWQNNQLPRIFQGGSPGGGKRR